MDKFVKGPKCLETLLGTEVGRGKAQFDAGGALKGRSFVTSRGRASFFKCFLHVATISLILQKIELFDFLYFSRVFYESLALKPHFL